MIHTVVFTGPTLDPADAHRLFPEAEIRGPAACGDLYRAARSGARVIGLIDGYFEQRLSVWHKEVLWALSTGVHVLGGGSMGALRAAELDHFGMVGVGAIYQAFADGTLEDDDEVAVAHEAAERGYRLRSDAMVNLRATFAAAERGGIVTPATATQLVRIGKRLFYPERSFRAVLDGAASSGLPATELSGLATWLWRGGGIVDQKRRDGIALLETSRQIASQDKPLPAVSFQFEYTESWHELTRRISL